VALESEERRIAAWVDAHVDEPVELLERVVNQNSGTLNLAGVRRVGDVFRRELDVLGFATRWIDGAAVGRAGHLFAEHEGEQGKRLLLVGHLDTVFEAESPFQRFERQGNTAHGPGVADMKGGDVVMLQALRALHATGALAGTRIIVAIMGDEENPGDPVETSRRELLEAARRSDVALDFEAGVRDADGEYATVARRGSVTWRLEVVGETGHSSGIFTQQYGSGAIFEAARILNAFHEELRGEAYLSVSPGLFLGGTDIEDHPAQARGHAAGKDNVVARSALVAGDLRSISPEQLADALRRMRAIVGRHHPRTSASITFTESYPAMPPTEANRALLAELNVVNRDLGYSELQPLDPRRRGAADISFVAPFVPSLSGLGAHGEGAHSSAEVIDLATLPRQITRAALFLYRLTR
jgi:glutamate carboxypeptidase